MKHIQEALEILGLSQKEIKIVLILSSKGHKGHFMVSEVSRMIKIPRTTIIPILDKLKKRGFVDQVYVGGHKEWQVVAPRVFHGKLKVAMRAFE